MLTNPLVKIVLCLALFVSAIAATAAGQAPSSSATPSAPEESLTPEDQAARATFELVCGACHEAAVATTTFRTPQEWSELLDMMVSFGASASDAQFMQINRYLNRRYGRVNINRAPADDLALVLDLTPEQVQAIIDYRSTVRFTSADDVKNVKGMLPASVDAFKDRLQF